MAETAMYRYKTIVGRRLHARTLPNQRTEAIIGCNVLNPMTTLGMPTTVRIRLYAARQRRRNQRSIHAPRWVQMPIDVMRPCSIDASDDWRHGYADFCNTSRPNASALGPVYGSAGPAEAVLSAKCVLAHHANVRRVVTEVAPMTSGEDENGHAFAGPFQRHSAGQRRRDWRIARHAARLRSGVLSRSVHTIGTDHPSQQPARGQSPPVSCLPSLNVKPRFQAPHNRPAQSPSPRSRRPRSIPAQRSASPAISASPSPPPRSEASP